MEKNFGKMLKMMCVDADVAPGSLASAAGMTRQNFNRKLKAGTLRLTEAVDAMKALGYKVYAEKDGQKLDIY